MNTHWRLRMTSLKGDKSAQRKRNLINKRLQEERGGEFRIKIIPDKKKYQRNKFNIKEIENEL